MKSRAFTLIELLIVVSIIALLSGIVITAVGISRAKAVNTKFMQELYDFQLGTTRWFLDTGSLPSCWGIPGCVSDDLTTAGGIEAIVQPLIDKGFISGVPHYPGWQPGNSKAYLLYTPNKYTGSDVEKVICGVKDTATWDPADESEQGAMVIQYTTPQDSIYLNNTRTTCTTSGGNLCTTEVSNTMFCLDLVNI